MVFLDQGQTSKHYQRFEFYTKGIGSNLGIYLFNITLSGRHGQQQHNNDINDPVFFVFHSATLSICILPSHLMVEFGFSTSVLTPSIQAAQRHRGELVKGTLRFSHELKKKSFLSNFIFNTLIRNGDKRGWEINN